MKYPLMKLSNSLCSSVSKQQTTATDFLCGKQLVLSTSSGPPPEIMATVEKFNPVFACEQTLENGGRCKAVRVRFQCISVMNEYKNKSLQVTCNIIIQLCFFVAH